MVYSARSMLLLAYAHLGRLGGARVLTRAVLMSLHGALGVGVPWIRRCE
jgi:hypothetical protein